MPDTTVKAIVASRPSVKLQLLATFGAIITAVALPQLFHAVGAVAGIGTSLGEAFLPMQLPIILVGFLAGPFAGAVAGLLGPVASFVLSGMPKAAMLPFIIIELCVYGLSAGLLKKAKLPTIGKLFVVQLAGRAVRSVAVLLAVFVFAANTVTVSSIWQSILTGLPGLLLQWALMPLIVFRLNSMMKNEQ